MPKSKTNRWILAIAFALSAGGFLIQFWPLEVIGILIAAFSGHYVFALVLGMLLDLAFGAPTGGLRYLFFPFTLIALVAFLGRHLAGRYIVSRGVRDTL